MNAAFSGANNAGTLQLDHSQYYDGTVSGLALGDVIDLADTAATTAAWNGSTLAINGVTATFTIAGLPGADTFAYGGDGQGGTDLTVILAPTITGTVAGQMTTSEAPVTPFSGVMIGDANNGGSNTDTLTITYTAADGTLADGASFTGLSGSSGDYTLSGTAAEITSEATNWRSRRSTACPTPR